MDFRKALTYAFDDPEFANKAVVTIVLGIIPILNLAVFGWMLDLIQNMLAGAEHPMPDWNDLGTQLGERWVQGLIAIVGVIIYYIPMILIACALGVILIPALALTGSTFLTDMISQVIFWVYGAAIWIILAIGVMRYAGARKFNVFLELGRNFDILQKNFNTMIYFAIYWIAFSVILWAIGWVLGFIPCLGWLIAAALSFLFYTAVNATVMGHLMGQAANEIRRNTKRE